MVENEREAEQRKALKAKQEKLNEAASSLADLVRRFKMENPMDEDMQVDPSDELPIRSPTPSRSGRVAPQNGL